MTNGRQNLLDSLTLLISYGLRQGGSSLERPLLLIKKGVSGDGVFRTSIRGWYTFIHVTLSSIFFFGHLWHASRSLFRDLWTGVTVELVYNYKPQLVTRFYFTSSFNSISIRCRPRWSSSRHIFILCSWSFTFTVIGSTRFRRFISLNIWFREVRGY